VTVIKTHYTAKDLAGLPGMPETQKGVIDKGNRSEIASRPIKKKDGSDSKFREYAVTSLPAETRRYLAGKNTKIGYAPEATAMATQLQQTAAESEAQRLEARRESTAAFNRLQPWQKKGASAKLEIIKASQRYIDDHGLAKHEGQNGFTHEYNLGRIDVAPWVRAEIREFHPQTLRDWVKTEFDLGVMGLVDCYGNRKGQSKIETYITGTDEKGNPVKPLVTTILALICKHPHIKEKKLNETLRSLLPEAPYVSDKSIGRWVEAWKKAHVQEWDYIVNPDNWKNKHLTAAGVMDEGIRYILNKRWEIDATPADLMLTDGRNKIIGLIDVGTRRLILQVTPTEKGLDNGLVVRRGILAWGVPATGTFISDQGNPYKSEIFTRFLDGMDIEHELCPAFSGDRKPFIERAFRTFSHDLVEMLDGYCGHSVADRKAIESRKSFAERLMGKDEVIEAKLTAQELQQFCDRWCAAYHDRVHGTLGKSPNQVVNEWTGAIHRITDERALDVLLSPVAGDDGWRTVTKRGIKINHHWYIHGEFGIISGQRVQALETEDVGRVIINRHNEHGIIEFVGLAECPELTGISRAEVAAIARARQKRVIAQANELKKQARRELKGQDIATAVLEHRERQAAEAQANIVPFPRPTIDYTSPGLQAAGEAAQALRGRTAPIEHPPELQAKRAALIEQNMRRLEAQLTEEIKAERPNVVTLQVPGKCIVPEDRRERWLLWNRLHDRIVDKEELNDEESQFYHSFRKSPTWRSFAKVYNPALAEQ